MIKPVESIGSLFVVTKSGGGILDGWSAIRVSDTEIEVFTPSGEGAIGFYTGSEHTAEQQLYMIGEAILSERVGKICQETGEHCQKCTELKITCAAQDGTFCSVCEEPEVKTSEGATCKHGHGVAHQSKKGEAT